MHIIISALAMLRGMENDLGLPAVAPIATVGSYGSGPGGNSNASTSPATHTVRVRLHSGESLDERDAASSSASAKPSPASSAGFDDVEEGRFRAVTSGEALLAAPALHSRGSGGGQSVQSVPGGDAVATLKLGPGMLRSPWSAEALHALIKDAQWTDVTADSIQDVAVSVLPMRSTARSGAGPRRRVRQRRAGGVRGREHGRERRAARDAVRAGVA